MTDEAALWDAVCAGEKARDAGARLGIPPKRVVYLCEKWARAGIYLYGTSADLGWPTKQATRQVTVDDVRAAAQAMLDAYYQPPETDRP